MSAPHEHAWLSGLFGDAEIAAILAPEAELARMLRVEAAWTRALGEVEGHQDAARVADAVAATPVPFDLLREGTARDGVPVPALVRAIRSRLPEADHALVHRGLTSQDVMDTALVLALREAIAVLVARVDAVDGALRDLARRVEGRGLTAFTRMQPALSVTAETMVETWRRPVAAFGDELRDASERLGIVQYGGPVGARDHPEAAALGRSFARGLGLRDPGHGWHTDRARLAELAALLARIAGAAGKIGTDVTHRAALGAQHIALAGGGGSSAMPHKSNPVEAEALVALARHAATLVGGFHQALVHEHHRSGQAWMLEWLTLPPLLTACARSLMLARRVVESIRTLGVADGA